jgi:hypothetical protein
MSIKVMKDSTLPSRPSLEPRPNLGMRPYSAFVSLVHINRDLS